MEIKTSRIKKIMIRRNKGFVSKEVIMEEKRLKFRPSKEEAIDNAKLMTVMIDAKMGMELRLAFKILILMEKKDLSNDRILNICLSSKYKKVV